MQITPIITFRGIAHSDALESDIRGRIAKLDACGPIVGCRVLVELLQRHHETGNRFHVRIELTVPGEEIVVAHDASLYGAARVAGRRKVTKADEVDPARQHAHVAVREAFAVARRRLQDFGRRQRGEVKKRVHPPRGRVARLFGIGGYGYIEAEDGHLVYFQRSSVLGGAFDRLTPGSTVSFAEEPGENGPQASTVRLLNPRRARQVPTIPAEPVRQ
jgi:cold shock CspA family protein